MADGSPILALLIFWAITTIYICVRWFSTDAYKSRHVTYFSKIVSIGYIFIILVTQFFINVGHTKTFCGTAQKSKALIYTLVPNIFMFGIVFGLLIILPGWKAPFSNTIGYMIIKTMGVGDLLRKMLRTDIKENSSKKKTGGESNNAVTESSSETGIETIKPEIGGEAPKLIGGGNKTFQEQATETRIEMKEILKYVNDDPSLLVNEITPGNWDKWMNNTGLPKLFKTEYKKDINHQDIQKLYNLISLRDLVGEYIWLILSGFLVITTQTNALYSINCKGRSTMLENKIKEQTEKLAQITKERTDKVFYTRE
jgi:hypothetical protein